MSIAANNELGLADTGSGGFREAVEAAALEHAEQWLKVCDGAHRWHRSKFVLNDPSAKDRQELERYLPWLIRATRMLHSNMLDPNWAHREVARRVEAALWQLDQIWLSEHNPMSDAEADKLMADIFANAPRA